ncbi:MAG: ATP-binding protein [Planctomycetota bacterium]
MPTILIIHSDAQQRSTLADVLNHDDWKTIAVDNANAAEERLAADPCNAIVCEFPAHAATRDASQPPETKVDGEISSRKQPVDSITSLVNTTPNTPLILVSSDGDHPTLCHALLRGAAAYIPVTLDGDTIVETVERVLEVHASTRDATTVDGCATACKLELTLPSQESLVPDVIAKLETTTQQMDLFDEMIWMQVGMALDEAILNAMIHGNLEVDSSLREIDDGEAYWEAIRQRREQAPYSQRRTFVTVTATRHQAVFVIRDQGPGFDRGSVIDATDPENLEALGGRGLLMIDAFMDEVIYNDAGNEITMIKRKAAGPRDDD